MKRATAFEGVAHQAAICMVQQDELRPLKDQYKTAEDLIAGRTLHISDQYSLCQQITQSTKRVAELETQLEEAGDAYHTPLRFSLGG